MEEKLSRARALICAIGNCDSYSENFYSTKRISLFVNGLSVHLEMLQ